MRDHRMTYGLIHDILDALERHGYIRGDDQHAGRAIGLIGDLARIYDGTQDYPASAHLTTEPSSLPADPGPSGQPARMPSSSLAAMSGPSWPRWT